jgi:phage FluMu protein Com
MSHDALADDTPTPPAPRDVRCHCGSLVARVVDRQLELRCRRCQRIALVSLQAAGEIEVRWSDGASTKPEGKR